MTITDKQAMREKFEAWAIDGLRGVAAAWAFADPRALFNMQGGEGRTYYIDDVESAFRGYCAALEAAEAARDVPACPHCKGSGETTALEGGGPDAYEVPVNCGHCGGTGSAPSSAEQPATGAFINPQHIAADIVRSCAHSGIEVDALDVLAAVERALPELDPAPAFGQSYRCARCSDLMPKPPEPHLYCVKCSRADADRLDDLETNCWGLKAFAIPDTDGDGDEFGWKVVQQRTHGGRDVVIATEHSDDLRAAIDAASGVDRGDSYHG